MKNFSNISTTSILSVMKKNNISTAEMAFISHFRNNPIKIELNYSELKSEETIHFILQHCGFEKHTNVYANTSFFKHASGMMFYIENERCILMGLESLGIDNLNRISAMLNKYSTELIIWKKAA